MVAWHIPYRIYQHHVYHYVLYRDTLYTCVHRGDHIQGDYTEHHMCWDDTYDVCWSVMCAVICAGVLVWCVLCAVCCVLCAGVSEHGVSSSMCVPRYDCCLCLYICDECECEEGEDGTHEGCEKSVHTVTHTQHATSTYTNISMPTARRAMCVCVCVCASDTLCTCIVCNGSMSFAPWCTQTPHTHTHKHTQTHAYTHMNLLWTCV